LVLLASTLIRLPNGTLGDIYGPVNVQLASIYPVIVFLLVTRSTDTHGNSTNAFSNYSTDRTLQSTVSTLKAKTLASVVTTTTRHTDEPGPKEDHLDFSYA
jgi:hypothetical protein